MRKNKIIVRQMAGVYLLLLTFTICCNSQNKKEVVQEKREGVCRYDTTLFISRKDPDTLFEFSNGKTFGVRGYIELENKKKIFSEFIISECKSGKTVDTRSAVVECELGFRNDTLRIIELTSLAIGENFEYKKVPWKETIFFYRKNELKRQDKLLKASFKLTQADIDITLKEYEATEWKHQINVDLIYTSQKMNLANRLMIAAVLGNLHAEKYFREFKEKFRPDGDNAEWYNEWSGILEFAKKQ
jgi:hypothetical protein